MNHRDTERPAAERRKMEPPMDADERRFKADDKRPIHHGDTEDTEMHGAKKKEDGTADER